MKKQKEDSKLVINIWIKMKIKRAGVKVGETLKKIAKTIFPISGTLSETCHSPEVLFLTPPQEAGQDFVRASTNRIWKSDTAACKAGS